MVNEEYCLCYVVQVRASAVYALGTFISNVSEKSDHASNIDLGVGMKLVAAAVDGSPLVRKVGTGCLHDDTFSLCLQRIF